MHPQRDVIQTAQNIHENVAGRARAKESIQRFQDQGVADSRKEAGDLYRKTLLVRADPNTGEVKLPGHVDDVNPITLKVNLDKMPKNIVDKERSVRGDKQKRRPKTWKDAVAIHREVNNPDRKPNMEDR